MFSDLTAEPEHFAAEVTYLKGTVLDELVSEGVAIADDVTSVFLEAAREALRVDLYESWGYDIESDDTTAFEDRVTASETRLKFALAAKQLELVYAHFDQGEGSLNRDRYLYWKNEYADRRRAFPSLGTSHFGPRVSTIDVQL